MPTRITRRKAAQLLMSAPAALALPDILRGAPAPAKRPTTRGLSPADRRSMEKSISQLRSTAEKVRKVPMPMGSEPAFVFRPILPPK